MQDTRECAKLLQKVRKFHLILLMQPSTMQDQLLQKPGAVIGSAGPTTSGRMDAYAPTMMSVGARGMIGKGARLPEVVDAMKKYDGVYFGAIGGAGALLDKMHQKG